MEYKSACETFLLMDSVPQTVSEQIKMEWVKTRISLHADTIPFFMLVGWKGNVGPHAYQIPQCLH